MKAALLLCFLTACAGHGSSGGGACHDLSLRDCRLTAGCTPDVCAACVCDLTYRGCLAAGEQPATSCPALGCPSGVCCSDQTECQQGQTTCAPPGTPPGCGVCNNAPGDCTSDAQCKQRGPTLVCNPIPCSCDGRMQCEQGCVNDTMCGDGTRCDLASARCVAITCSGDAQCPPNFHCSGSTCTRDVCSDDNDCDGFCVLGQCFANGRGECRGPSA